MRDRMYLALEVPGMAWIATRCAQTRYANMEAASSLKAMRTERRRAKGRICVPPGL